MNIAPIYLRMPISDTTKKRVILSVKKYYHFTTIDAMKMVHQWMRGEAIEYDCMGYMVAREYPDIFDLPVLGGEPTQKTEKGVYNELLHECVDTNHPGKALEFCKWFVNNKNAYDLYAYA